MSEDQRSNAEPRTSISPYMLKRFGMQYFRRVFGLVQWSRRVDLNKRHEKAARMERAFMRNHRRNMRLEGLS